MGSSYWDADISYDAESVRFFDVAHEGAQVRALIPVVKDFSRRLSEIQFRSALIIPTDSVARACAHFVAEQQTALPVMVAQADSLPSFIGALDLVIVVGERAVADSVSQALIAAASRGAVTVFIGPSRGPLREDVPAETLLLPSLPTVQGASPARFIAGLQLIFASLGQAPEATEGYLSGIASQLDEELEHLSPERGVEVNPGRQLREFVHGAHVIHTGGALARVAAAIWAAGGLGGTFVETDLVPLVLERREQERRAQGGQQPDGEDLFYDPVLDGPPLVVSKVISWRSDLIDSPELVSLPHSWFAPAAGADAHPLQLIVRAFAATAYNDN